MRFHWIVTECGCSRLLLSGMKAQTTSPSMLQNTIQACKCLLVSATTVLPLSPLLVSCHLAPLLAPIMRNGVLMYMSISFGSSNILRTFCLVMFWSIFRTTHNQFSASICTTLLADWLHKSGTRVRIPHAINGAMIPVETKEITNLPNWRLFKFHGILYDTVVPGTR